MRRQSFRGARFVARTLVTCLVGCAPQPVEHPISTVRDSAGIRIVENAPPAVSNEVWSVDTVPVLRIGQVNGMPEHQLYRVGPLARLSDGTVVVALVSELRFYAADGTWMQTVGRQGGGPGEYEEIGMLRRLRGDSLLVWDGGQRRVTVLGPDGSFGRAHIARE